VVVGAAEWLCGPAVQIAFDKRLIVRELFFGVVETSDLQSEALRPVGLVDDFEDSSSGDVHHCDRVGVLVDRTSDLLTIEVHVHLRGRVTDVIDEHGGVLELVDEFVGQALSWFEGSGDLARHVRHQHLDEEFLEARLGRLLDGLVAAADEDDSQNGQKDGGQNQTIAHYGFLRGCAGFNRRLSQ